MATNDKLNEKLDTLQTALDAEQEQVQAAIDKLQKEVDDLKAAEIVPDSTIDRLDGIIADLKSTIKDEPETPLTE